MTPVRLVELEPEFIRWEDRPHEVNRVVPGYDTRTDEGLRKWIDDGQPTVREIAQTTFLVTVPTLAEAQGIEFDCPKCRNHRLHVAFSGRGVADHHGTRGTNGQPTRWTVTGGSGYSDLTLSPSIDVTASMPNCWHGFIQDGVAT